MKRFLFYLTIVLCINSNAQVSCMLPIAPRIQWPNNDGYCGENSIQMCGLYYGNYISEGLCRTVAGGELLIYVNDTVALDKFSFTFKEWDPNAATPQYMNYLDWVKQYLHNNQPVIIAVYVSGMTDPDYDHIIPAIGFKGTSVNSYAASDSLTYNSNFDTTPFTRVFSTLYATRANANNSASFPYYIPKNINYGVAVTGNKDPNHLTKPVHIDLDSNDEPNVSLGATACVLKAIITADSLTAGQSYALLRYNNYLTVPSINFTPAGASSVVYFTAAAVTKILTDTFMSDAAVFYRCIPYSTAGINQLSVNNNQVTVYPNPASTTINVELNTQTLIQNTSIEIYTVTGACVKQLKIKNEGLKIDVSDLSEGIYNLSIISNEGVINKKLVIVR